MRDIFDLLGRIFLCAIFIFEAIDNLAQPTLTKQFMQTHGITWGNPNFLLYGGAFMLIFGGILLLIGYRSTFGAILLLLYWLPVTFFAHDFWDFPKAQLREESIIFMKNMAIVGGLFMVIANGSGKYSIKRWMATTRV